MAGSTQNWKPAAIRYLLFGGLVAGCLLTIFILAADTAKKLETLRLEASDNISWTLAQMDVESLALQISVLRAKANANIAELGELRLRYDILYSRVQTIKNSPLFDALHNSPDMQQLVEEISSSLNQILPIIDGDNAGLRSSLNQLDMIAIGIREQARELSLAAVSVYAERSDDNREAIAYTLLLLALFTSLLIFVLLILVTILYRLYEEVRKSAARQAVATSRLEGIIRASPSGIILADSTGRILEFNESAQKIFGYTRKEVLGATASRLLLEPEVGKFHDDRIADFLSGGDETYVNAGSRDTFALRKNGQIFPATIATAASWTETKPHFVIFVRDITDRKRVEAEILTARDRAQAGERAKSYLLAMVSHEIRTPLNGIIGILSLLASTSLNQRQKEYVKMMRDSGKLLRAHVDDLLDISSIETGQVQILARPVDLRELLSDTADSQRTLVSSNKNELTVNVIQQEKSQLMLDAGRVHQTLVNLINNATKFTKNGKIIVEAEVEKNHDGTTVEFRVIDNGVGIEEADQVRIFQDFITLDPSYSRHYEGTGLGLGIVRRLVEAMDGEYGVESEPGAGSVFWFRLP
ncbi:MAG: ATP-binding protein, partial [Paracoccaceae bacterium]|nr:ATP-binding protein [Paracoccaceae bacterium]